MRAFLKIARKQEILSFNWTVCRSLLRVAMHLQCCCNTQLSRRTGCYRRHLNGAATITASWLSWERGSSPPGSDCWLWFQLVLVEKDLFYTFCIWKQGFISNHICQKEIWRWNSSKEETLSLAISKQKLWALFWKFHRVFWVLYSTSLNTKRRFSPKRVKDMTVLLQWKTKGKDLWIKTCTSWSTSASWWNQWETAWYQEFSSLS